MSEAVIDQATFDDLKEMVGDDFIGEFFYVFGISFCHDKLHTVMMV